MEFKLLTILFFMFINVVDFQVLCLDFSQFYLPECCYIPPPPSNSIDQHNVHQQSSSVRHDIKARRADPTHLINSKNSNTTSTSSSSGNKQRSNLVSPSESNTKNSKASATRLYRYIIPIKKFEMEATEKKDSDETNEDSSSSSSSSVEKDSEKVPTSGKLPTSALMRENGVKMRKSLQKSMKMEKEEDAEQLLSSAQTEAELKPKELNKSNTSQLPSIESILFSKNSTLIESMLKFKRNVRNPKNNNNNNNTTTTRTTARTTTRTPIRRIKPNSIKTNMVKTTPLTKNNEMMQSIQQTLKMPGNWVTNLRRALYQSMDSMMNREKALSKSSKADDETILTKSSNYNPRQRSSQEDQSNNNNNNRNQVTVLWKKLREANFTLIEPLTRSASSIPSTLYLPTGQGPIASGVVVNTVNGLQLRMASDLSFRQDEPKTSESNLQSAHGNCNCHLIHNGEILMAYWSVSRIINENGQPALQYLIYPLPHNVPTPPVMIPFSGDKSFNAAQYNLNHGNRYQNIQQVQHQQQNPNPNHHHGHHQNQNHHQQQQQQQYHQQSHIHNINNPGLQYIPTTTSTAGHLQNEHYEEFHHLQEVPVDYVQKQPQAPNPLAFPPHQEQVFQNLQQFNQLPPPTPPLDDRTGYRGVVIENQHGYTPEFINAYKQALENQLLQQSGNPNLNQNFHNSGGHKGHNFPVSPHLQQQQHGLQSPLENPLYGNVDKHLGITNGPPPSHIQLFDGSKTPPGFPKSIQDILSPFPGTISLPENPGFPGPGPSLLPQTQQQPVDEDYRGVVNFGHNFHNQHTIHQQNEQFGVGGFPGGPGGVGPSTSLVPQKNFDVNNFYSFRGEGLILHNKDGGSGGEQPFSGNPINHHHHHPDQNPNQNYPQSPPLNTHHHSHHPDQHDGYPPSNNRQPHRYTSTSDIGYDRNRYPITRPGGGSSALSKFAGSNDDDITRYHRTQQNHRLYQQQQQQLPSRHRSEKYSRPSNHHLDSSSQRPSGSYILNF